MRLRLVLVVLFASRAHTQIFCPNGQFVSYGVLLTKQCGANKDSYCSATQSSYYNLYGQDRSGQVAVNGVYNDFTWTNDGAGDNQPWWRVDLESPVPVGILKLTRNPSFGAYPDYGVYVGNSTTYNSASNYKCGTLDASKAVASNNYSVFSSTCIGTYRYLFIQRGGHLSFSEVELFSPFCLNCSGCGPGFGVQTNCTEQADTVCAPCAPGTVSDGLGSCLPCKANHWCPGVSSENPCPDLSTSSGGTATCSCQEGYFWNASFQCQPCSTCAADQYMSKACTNATDTVCLNCPDGSNSPANSTSVTACKCTSPKTLSQISVIYGQVQTWPSATTLSGSNQMYIIRNSILAENSPFLSNVAWSSWSVTTTKGCKLQPFVFYQSIVDFNVRNPQNYIASCVSKEVTIPNAGTYTFPWETIFQRTDQYGTNFCKTRGIPQMMGWYASQDSCVAIQSGGSQSIWVTSPLNPMYGQGYSGEYAHGWQATINANVAFRLNTMSGTPNVNECLNCGANTYWNNSFCSLCPGNSTSDAGSSGKDLCNCNANFYKDMDVCVTCPGNSSSVSGSLSISNCTCNNGYYRVPNDTCVPCPAGYRCTNDIKYDCPQNTYSLGTAGTCTPCIANSFSSMNSDSCTCNDGYKLDYFDPATSIVNGQKDLARSCSSVNCPVTLWEGLGNTTIPTFQQNWNLDTGLTFVTNGNYNSQTGGHFWNAIGTYQIDLQKVQKIGTIWWFDNGAGDIGGNSNNLPMQIYAGWPTPLLVGNVTSFTCCKMNKIDLAYGIETQYVWFHFPKKNSGTTYGFSEHYIWRLAITPFSDENKICNQCKTGSFCFNQSQYSCPLFQTSLAGNINESQCFCSAGYISTGPSTCRACNPGYSCPLPSTTGIAAGQPATTLNYTETICPTGTFSVAASTSCTQCAANTYADSVGSGSCTACPANSAGAAGSTSKVGCNCNNGYYRDINLNCVLCPAGYRCSGNAMVACAKGTSSAIGASTCSNCAQGFYADEIALPVCKTCPAGSTVAVDTVSTMFHSIIDRPLLPNISDVLFVQRKYLLTQGSAGNITQWSFFATGACTVTPVLLDNIGSQGSVSGYRRLNLVVSAIGTTRTVVGGGAYTYDFLEGRKVPTRKATWLTGDVYAHLQYLGWYFTGLACIPYTMSAASANPVNDHVVSVQPFNLATTVWSDSLCRACATPPCAPCAITNVVGTQQSNNEVVRLFQDTQSQGMIMPSCGSFKIDLGQTYSNIRVFFLPGQRHGFGDSGLCCKERSDNVLFYTSTQSNDEVLCHNTGSLSTLTTLSATDFQNTLVEAVGCNGPARYLRLEKTACTSQFSMQRLYIQNMSSNASVPPYVLPIQALNVEDDVYSVSLKHVVTNNVFATATTGSISALNCTCGSDRQQAVDGSCSGSCLSGFWLNGTQCEQCSAGFACSGNFRTSCATQTSSRPGWSQCQPCAGPDTHSDISHAMCGIRTCPESALVPVGTTGWMGVGQITTGQGGNGVIPSTYWFAGYKCLGLVLNSTADRPVSLVQQTLTVTPGKTYAVRYKFVCTGAQCGARFQVIRKDMNTVFSDLAFVQRSWTEGATPYFTPTNTTVTIQFRAEMVTGTATIWLAQIELVDLGRWSYNSISTIQLKTGVELPVRYSANYVQNESHVLMQINAGGYIEQTAGAITGQTYELIYWYSGSIAPSYWNGTAYTSFTQGPAYDNATGYTQAVFYLVPTSSPVLVRFSGVGQMTKPSLKIYTPLATAPCRACLNNYWCAGSTLNRCPLNTISNNLSVVQTDCFCKPGYFGIVGMDQSVGYSPCSLCPMNSYCAGGNQKEFCPNGTKSQPGSDLSGCTPCAEGEFCAMGQVGTCPANSYAPPGSDSQADCGCNPGYYGTLGNCKLCESGYYCPGGPDRVACTANAVSPAGSVNATQCFCDRGYYGVNNTPCTACQEGYWCWTGVRNLCPPNMWSPLLSSYQDNCSCTYGYTGPNGGPCTECSAGFFKTTRGSDNCTACAAGTSSLTVAATSSDTCAQCNRGSFNMFTGQSVCTMCDAGTVAGVFGSTNCSSCAAGTWSPQGAATCSPCLAGTYSTITRASSANQCLPCPTGAYSSAGSTQCQLCGACSWWQWPMRINFQFTLGSATSFATLGTNTGTMMTLVSSTVAIVNDVADLYRLNIATGSATAFTYDKKDTTPITHLEASRDRTSLYMVQGGYAYRFSMPDVQGMNAYGQEGIGATGITENAAGNLVWITANTFMRAYNKDMESTVHTVNYPSPFASATASPCVHASYPNEIFVAGKSMNGNFGFRKYNTATGVWTTITTEVSSLNKCVFTHDGLFVFLTSSSNTWVWNMMESNITRFYVGQVNGMIVDPNQNFVLLARQLNSVQRQAIVIQDPRNCPVAQYSTVGGLQSPLDCSTCPAGSLCPGGAAISQCNAGTYSTTQGLREQGQCTVCPAGHFCTGGDAIVLCPLGSYSLATNVTRVQDCNKCPAGFYCTNTTVIVACPANTMSPVGSSDLAQCTCAAGYRCEVTKVVHAEVVLPISIVDFQALELQYRQAVAAAAGVSVDQVIIVSVTNAVSGGARRRLLSTVAQPTKLYTEIHTSIYNSKYNEKPHLALRDLQRQLHMRGLPRHEVDMRITLHHEVTKSAKATSLAKH